MKTRFFTLVALTAFMAIKTPITQCAEGPVDRTRTYTTVAAAGATLIGLAVLYETILANVGENGGLVQIIANAFRQAAPAFVSLQRDIRENIGTTDIDKAQAATALKGLVALLETPGDLHKLLPQTMTPAHIDVLSYVPTAAFLEKVQAIARSSFYMPLDGQAQPKLSESRLSQEGYLFYDLVRQMIVHVFIDLLPGVTDNLKDTSLVSLDDKSGLVAYHAVAPKDESTQVAAPAIAPKVESKPAACDGPGCRQDRLHIAILNDSAEGVREAVKLGADFNQGQGDRSHLLWAVLLRKSNALDALLELGAKDRKVSNVDLAQYSVSLGDFKSVMLFAQKGGVDLKFRTFKDNQRTAQFNAYYGEKSLVMTALERGDIKSAISLVKMDVSLSPTPFMNIVNSIFEPICVPSSKRSICSTQCSYDSCANNSDVDLGLIEELIQELIKHGCNPNEIWNQSVHERWFYQQEGILKIFLKNGADPNYKIKNGQQTNLFKTPLLKAIEAGSTNAVQSLLDAGAKIRIPDYQWSIVRNGQFEPQRGEYNVLDYALEWGNPEIVDLLIERGA